MEPGKRLKIPTTADASGSSKSLGLLPPSSTIKMMKTLLTFAEFHREAPLVLEAKWPKFQVLFMTNSAEVRVRERYRIENDGLVDFVLTVELVREKRPKWRVHLSLAGFSEAHRYERYRFADGYWKSIPALQSTEISLGEVVKFRFPPEKRQDEFKMMLTVVDDKAKGHRRGGGGRSLLTNLPVEVRRRVLSFLPLKTLIDIVPFVSLDLFNFAKGAGGWEEVTLICYDYTEATAEECRGGFAPSSRELEAFCRMAVESSCQLMTIEPDRCPYPVTEDARRFSSTLFLDHSWRNLAKLVIDADDELPKPTLQVLQQGMRNGNFRALESLTLSNLAHPIPWSFLENCQLPNLKYLSLYPGVSETAASAVVDGSVHEILNRLEVLSLGVTSVQVWNELLPKDQRGETPAMAGLDKLKLSNVTIEELDVRQLHLFERSRVTKLEFESIFYQQLPAPVLAIFSSSLKSLTLGPMTNVCWRCTTPGAAGVLAGLTRYDGPFLFPNGQPVPFGRMPALKEALITSPSVMAPVPAYSHYCASMAALITSTELRTLAVLGGFSLLFDWPVGTMACVRSNVLVDLTVGRYGGRFTLDDTECTKLGRFFRRFPAVERLHLQYGNITVSPATLASVVFETLDNVEHGGLYISTKSINRWEQMRKLDEVKEILKELRESRRAGGVPNQE